MTARGAGVFGFMKFGAKTQFALDAELSAQTDVIKAFLAQNGGAPFLMFGFTWLVWTGLYQQFADGEIDLSKGILFHSGGWKKLTEYKVSNDAFRTALKRRFGLERIYNFYGMVEQIGSVFLEASDGCLYPSNIADIIVRDDRTWMPVPPGVPGLIQLVSLLPHSYPGHSLLTEDLGEIVYVDEHRRSPGKGGTDIGSHRAGRIAWLLRMSLGQRRAHDCSDLLYCGNNCRTPIALDELVALAERRRVTRRKAFDERRLRLIAAVADDLLKDKSMTASRQCEYLHSGRAKLHCSACRGFRGASASGVVKHSAVAWHFICLRPTSTRCFYTPGP
jgi:hypothetical protein